jgi:hypothetical protein
MCDYCKALSNQIRKEERKVLTFGGKLHPEFLSEEKTTLYKMYLLRGKKIKALEADLAAARAKIDAMMQEEGHPTRRYVVRQVFDGLKLPPAHTMKMAFDRLEILFRAEADLAAARETLENIASGELGINLCIKHAKAALAGKGE